MRRLVESIFDDDLVQKDVKIDVQKAVDLVCDHLQKTFKVKQILPSRKAKPIKEGISIFYDEHYENGKMEQCWIQFVDNVNVSKTSNRYADYIGLCVSICISGDYKRKTDTVLGRIDVGWDACYDIKFDPYWRYLWEDNEYKHHTKLKSNKFNEKNLNNVLNYITQLCQTIVDMIDENGKEIVDTYLGKADLTNDNPLMYGKKDMIWWVEKLEGKI